jgi:very-short-patch-repair endonuclease
MRTNFLKINMFYGADSTTLRTAAILRKNMTLSEILLWKRLKDRKIFKSRFRRQHPVGMFIVDFYCHEYKLVIEVDGEVHNDREVIEYDLGRSAELNKFGLKVIRFTNDEVIYNIDSVIAGILVVITELTPPLGGQGAKNSSRKIT